MAIIIKIISIINAHEKKMKWVINKNNIEKIAK